MPGINDYYEPWTYDYATLTDAPAQEHTPVARPKSLISGEDMNIGWSANWDDNLGGSQTTYATDPVLAKVSEQVKRSLEETFMFYLPRIFVNLAMVENPATRDHLLLMARKLLRFMTVLGAIAVALGIGVGIVAPDLAVQLKPLGQAFVGLIKMMIQPIIFCTIVLGVGSVASAAKVGRVGGLALAYFMVMSTAALTIGMVVGNFLHPGDGLHVTADGAAIAQEKARSADVKAFAKTMSTDHTALQNDMKAAITAAGRTPPTELDQRRKGFLDNLRAASAAGSAASQAAR